MSEEIKEIYIKTYDEWLKYYENATKEQVIEDLTRDVKYFADAVKDIKDLQQKVEQKDKEIDRLNKEYERIYNENCKLRENHNINDITLLDENERLNRIIDNIFKFMQNKYDNSDLTGFTISFMELQDLKALKEE